MLHGARTPDKSKFYPKDPHANKSYHPYGYGQLTNKGKLEAYRLGHLLRQRYDKFLGGSYYPGVIDSWASNFDRTKATLQMVLASLFVPTKELSWHDTLKWQPIPFKFVDGSKERMFLATKYSTKAFKTYTDYVQSPEGQALIDAHRDVYEYVTENSGLKMRTPRDMLFMGSTLLSEEQFGLKLPQWTEKVWPEKIEKAAIVDYTMLMATKTLKTFNVGLIMQKIIDDSNLKIEGNSNCKIHLYSGHDITVAMVLICLNIFYPHVPRFCSNVLIELHQKDGVYGFKVFYQKDLSEEPKLYQVPQCDIFCTYNKFTNFIKDVLDENINIASI